MTADSVKKELRKKINPEKAAFFPRFFKTGKGQYGEGDIFIGVTVPHQRAVAKMFRKLDLNEIADLLASEVHEHRLTGLMILVYQFEYAKVESDKKKLADFYLKQISRVNNWDLVDTSAHYILGAYLFDKDKKMLYTLARSNNLWERRIAIIATYDFIRRKAFDDTFAVAEILLNDSEDLIHKAVGWMLREVGKRNQDIEEKFLKKHYKTMPRTMLRYAIEKFEPQKRAFYMKKD